jgi:GTP cyclohydrolase I
MACWAYAVVKVRKVLGIFSDEGWAPPIASPASVLAIMGSRSMPQELRPQRRDCMSEALTYGKLDKPRVEAAIRELLLALGEDPDRAGLRDTPDRVARACEEVFGGMQEDPSLHLTRQFHEPGNEDLVIVKDIPFSSMCEHHLLPFTGKAHICYLPRDGRITGLSKLARCVSGYARRPQLQERLTQQIADALVDRLNPHGVLVVLQASHSCMVSRGIKAAGSETVTSAVRGWFQTDNKARAEALRLLDL